MSARGPVRAPRGHVVVASDKFKGSLTARQVADHLAGGLRRVRPGTEVVTVPVADGGEGTLEAAYACGFTRAPVAVTGPAGERITAAYARCGNTAIVESAQASGMGHIKGRPAALTATSFGTGQLVAAAVAAGARRVVLGLGGSASTDGGTGMAAALGARFLDADGRPLPPGGGALGRLQSVETGDLQARLRGVTIVVVGDVDSPLLGPEGAACLFGPQKGATMAEVRVLETGLSRLDAIVRRDLRVSAAERPGAGAAGGTGFGAMVFLHAALESGAGYLLDLLGFTEQVAGARLVITGEGSLDRQTLRGKAPAVVARASARAGVPVIAVAGALSLTGEQLRRARICQAYALTDREPDLSRCIAEAGPLLEGMAADIARDWLPSPRSAGGASRSRRDG